MLRPTVSRPVCPCIRPPCETLDQFSFPFHRNDLKIFAPFFIMECPFWQDHWSEICSHKCYWALPAPSIWARLAELETILSYLRLRSPSFVPLGSQGYSWCILTPPPPNTSQDDFCGTHSRTWLSTPIWSTSPSCIHQARASQKTSLRLLSVFSLPGKNVSTELLPSSGSFSVTCLNTC
jgi:hypothetical protein